MNFNIVTCSTVSCLGRNFSELEEKLRLEEPPVALTRDHPWRERLQSPVGLIDFSSIESSLSAGPLTRIQQLAALLVDDLLGQVGGKQYFHGKRVAVVVGTTTAGIETWFEKFARDADDHAKQNPSHWFDVHEQQGQFSDFILGRLNHGGISITVSTACSSSNAAIIQAAKLLELGEVDVCIAGGLDIITPLTLFGFNALQLLDKNLCQPLTPERNGINLSEGGAFFVLEPANGGLDSQTQTGRHRPLAKLLGFGQSTDTYHMTMPRPDGAPMLRCMQQALDAAGWQAQDLDYINAHGTGTLANDISEWQALSQLLETDPSQTITNNATLGTVRVESSKSLHGHALAGAGALELAVSLIRLRQIQKKRGASERKSLKAISNSFGFGGHNATIAFAIDYDEKAAVNSGIKNFGNKAAGPYSMWYFASNYGPDDLKTSQHDLWRRLSWSSKGLMQAVADFEVENGIQLKELAREGKLEIYHLSLYGEMEAAVLTARGIVNTAIPVSPASFQQSVANSPIAYLSQKIGFNGSYITWTAKPDSSQLALHCGLNSLRQGTADAVLIVTTSEYHCPAYNKANADALCFSEVTLLHRGNYLKMSPSRFSVETSHITINTKRGASTDRTDQVRVIRPLLPCDLWTRKKKDSMLRLTGEIGPYAEVITHLQHHDIHHLYETGCDRWLPHRGSMLLVDRIIRANDRGSGLVSVRLKPDAKYFDQKSGIFLNHWLVEMMAQGCGTLSKQLGIHTGNVTGDPSQKIGFLISIDSYELLDGANLKPGDCLTIVGHQTVATPPVVKYESQVLFDGQIIAKATFKLFSPEEADG
jgi:3-oxoacyl-[acyl-carrier-protein] synthase I